MIDYKLLEAFAIVVQEGGFDRAATRLNLTQSAVSQRVKLLEERTGKILLSRSTPPQPTVAGRQLIKHYLQVKLLEEGLEQVLAESDRPARLPLGINADSLASWFLPAIGSLLHDGQILIDLHVDDQEQTHKLLKEGIVAGCISDKSAPMQGCRVAYLGAMTYRLLASPDFMTRWFADGLTVAAVKQAPLVVFNRKDMLQHRVLEKTLGSEVFPEAIHYVPAPEQFTQMILAGHAYGMVPDWQSEASRNAGQLIEVHPQAQDSVALYWHCWNLASTRLQALSELLVEQAGTLLA